MEAGTILGVVPVLPSADIDRDIKWYQNFTGFDLIRNDGDYAILGRGTTIFHLQWHADTPEDPLLGGSVVRIFVSDVKSYFDEFCKRGTVKPGKLILNTEWGTHEFGFYDLNRNAIFIVQDI
jgi:catechol 2,3-dioxygenase-like lactoylglutathione lyase family enzyme